MFNKYDKIKCKYCGRNITKNHLSRHIRKSQKCKIYQNHIEDIKTIDPWQSPDI
jgi:hypothetical protein